MNSATLSRSRPSQATTPLGHRISRSIVLKMLRRLQSGQIILNEGDTTYTFGTDRQLHAQITVHSPVFYSKVLFGGSIGAGEAYIEQYWDVDNLTNLIRIVLCNMVLLNRLERFFSLLLYPFILIGHAMKRNSKKGAKKNILAHYDIGNVMYESFLDETMMYSSAIFPHREASLAEASRYKLDIICRKLNLQPSDHVIEIGSGWGGFAIYAAREYGCHVTTTTISNAQYTEAAKRIAQAGLQDKITLLRQDYRDLSGKYDKLVSIEMVEAVGYSYLPQFFAKCSSLLKKNGIMLLQAITIEDQKFKKYVKSVDFIQRHIFPGGCLLSNRKMVELLSDETDMVVRSLEDFGLHYAKTLGKWYKRFTESYHTLREYGYDERFKRLWHFYLCYCQGGFLERSISVVHLLATRPQYKQDIIRQPYSSQ